MVFTTLPVLGMHRRRTPHEATAGNPLTRKNKRQRMFSYVLVTVSWSMTIFFLCHVRADQWYFDYLPVPFYEAGGMEGGLGNLLELRNGIVIYFWYSHVSLL